MSLMLNFCRSVPPEFLRSFLRWEGVAASIAFDDQCPVSRSAGSCKQHYQQPKLARLATLSLGLARCSYRQQNYQQPQQINNKNSANNHNCLALALARVNNQN